MMSTKWHLELISIGLSNSYINVIANDERDQLVNYVLGHVTPHNSSGQFWYFFYGLFEQWHGLYQILIQRDNAGQLIDNVMQSNIPIVAVRKIVDNWYRL